MNSFVKGFVPNTFMERGCLPELSQCTTEEKCKYYAHQLLMLRWEQTLFNGESTRYVEEFRREFKEEITAFFQSLHKVKESNLIIDTCERWMYFCYEGKTNRELTVSRVTHLLGLETEGNKIPEIAVSSFYKPYAHFLLNESLQNTEDFTQANGMSLPTMKLKSGCIAIANTQLPGYRYESSYQTKLVKQHMPEVFRFALGIDFSGLPVRSVLAPFSQTYITLDTHMSEGITGNGSLHTLYCNLNCILFRNHQSSVGCQSIPSYHVYGAFVSFLKEAHARYGVEFDEKRLPEQILGMNPDSVEKERLMTYLHTPRSQMSLEAYEYFKRSDFGVFPKLDILCQSTEAEDSNQEGDNDTDSSSENNKSGDSDNNSSEGDQDVGELASMVDDMENSDDSAGDNDTDQSGAGDDPDAGSDSSSTDTSSDGGDTTEKSPNLPNSNDSQGIEIKLSKGTNLDNYLFRQEVSKLIDTVLEQPERTYKEQDIALVKELKTYYLYIFDVETICEILAMATSIPIKFKKKETNK